MGSRGILLVLTLLLPLQDRRPDGGVWAQPHEPLTRLTAAEVDTLMWPVVEAINRSGWVWTTESCQGHPGGGPPMLGLITNDIGRLHTLLAEVLMTTGGTRTESQDPATLPLELTYFATPRLPYGRYQLRLVVRGVTAIPLFTHLATRIGATP
jgi:hypothetical protein